MSALDFAMMVEDTHVETQLIEYRRRGPDSGFTGRGEGDLFAMALTDTLGDGLSMVYSVYDPGLELRSLGTFMVLDRVARARRLGAPLRLSRLLGRRLAENGLQIPLSAAGAADATGLGARRPRRFNRLKRISDARKMRLRHPPPPGTVPPTAKRGR
ncbi:Aspartate/glutamate leucyltransferase [Bosea thiooxidans]